MQHSGYFSFLFLFFIFYPRFPAHLQQTNTVQYTKQKTVFFFFYFSTHRRRQYYYTRAPSIVARFVTDSNSIPHGTTLLILRDSIVYISEQYYYTTTFVFSLVIESDFKYLNIFFSLFHPSHHLSDDDGPETRTVYVSTATRLCIPKCMPICP